MKVIKKDGTHENYDDQKIINACSLAAQRALVKLTDEDYANICVKVLEYISDMDYYVEEYNMDIIPVSDMHPIVEKVLTELFPTVAQQYIQYRNYKINFIKMLDEVYRKEQEQRYIGDVSNANTDSTMISTQRSLSYGTLSRELYRNFFLNKDELQAEKDGYIYIHDEKDRRDGINCCLFDMENILKGGFEMGNTCYNEPHSLDVAFDVIGDVTFGASAQQYGGFTIPEIDKILAPYAEKSYQTYLKEYYKIADELGVNSSNDNLTKLADEHATKKVRREFEQGFQGWELKFNTVGSSRGDYPFIAISFGMGTSKWERMATESALEVRKNGQGKEGFKRPVLFPKLTFIYNEEYHGENKPFEYLFDKALDCSSKTMYPDYLSVSGEGYIPSMYKKYGKVVSLMGCRASLSPWYIKGGMYPLDSTDTPVFVGRCNLGAISLHLPMILAKARYENKNFYEVLHYYLELIRGLHKRTYAFLGEKKASTNPLAFTQGGFLNGTLAPNEKIKPLLKAMTMSFGITALNELQRLYNDKSIVEDGEFALEVMKYINEYIDRIKQEDGILYAVYATPAESLCGKQVEQFREKYGIVENVSDKPYVSNSFHCHVSEDITPIQKQKLENRFWNYFNGGKIQYCKYPIAYNKKALKTLVREQMKLGFYGGVNLSLAYCEDCGYEELEMNKCPKCGSEMITKIDRMNGYLGYTRIHGKPRYNTAKLEEINDRISM